jgi:hypothetical protein
VTADIARVIAQVPPVIESLTGLKVDDLIKGLRPTTSANDGEPGQKPPA